MFKPRTKEERLDIVKRLRIAALATLTDEQRLLLQLWLEAEAEAFEMGDYHVPSYTDGDAGASHGASAIATAIGESLGTPTADPSYAGTAVENVKGGR